MMVLRALVRSPLALLCILATGLEHSSTRAESAPDSVGTKRALENRLRGLELEYGIASRHPEAYYLVVDLAEETVELKAGARLLRRAQVEAVTDGSGQTETRLLRYRQPAPPVTPDPGTHALRLGGRHVPLDFWGRLTDGPRQRSRLCFDGGLVIQPRDIACVPPSLCVGLNAADLKSLGSALSSGASAILIPSPPTRRPENQ